jgi:hypothetical protein
VHATGSENMPYSPQHNILFSLQIPLTKCLSVSYTYIQFYYTATKFVVTNSNTVIFVGGKKDKAILVTGCGGP